MNRLLLLTAIVEAATGLALIATPNVVVRLLLGSEISGASIPLGRVAGLGLLSLAVACWHRGNVSTGTEPALRAMLLYNALVALYLVWLGVTTEWVGPLLWPAAALHGALTMVLAKQAWNSLK